MSENRTNEFLSIASSISPTDSPSGSSYSSVHNNPTNSNSNTSSTNNSQSKSNNSQYPNQPKSSLKSAAYAELRSFHTSASEISRDISVTSTLLTELTNLVRTRTLFMDDSDRVNTLVLQIKSNIENLNVRLEDSQKLIQTQKRRLGESSQAGQEASNIVGQLKQDFVKATTGFKKVLQQRSDWMKEQSERKQNVFGGNKQADHLSFMTTKPKVYSNNPLGVGGGALGSGGGGLLAQKSKLNMDHTLDLTSGLMMDVAKDEQNHFHTQQLTGETSSSTGMRNRQGFQLEHDYDSPHHNNQNPKTVLTPLEMQKLDEETGNAQMMKLIPDQEYLRERADAMTTVETNIVELGTIFNKLAVMVNEHREVVQRLEDNVNDANSNISLSMETLSETLTNLRTNKALFGKVLGILVTFIILFVTFFA